MADAYTWIKSLPSILRDYGLMIVALSSTVGGLSTGIYQYFDKQEVEAEKIKAIHEVAAGFQSVLAEKPQKQEVRQPACGKCDNSAIKREIEKLKRWH